MRLLRCVGFSDAKYEFTTGWWGCLFLSFAFAPFDFEVLPPQAALHIQIKKVEGTNKRRPQYVFRYLDGNPISKAQAKAIIQAKWGDLKY